MRHGREKQISLRNFQLVLFHSFSVFFKGMEVFPKHNSHCLQVLPGHTQVQFPLSLKEVELIIHIHYFSGLNCLNVEEVGPGILKSYFFVVSV